MNLLLIRIKDRLDYYIEKYNDLEYLKTVFANRHINEIIYSYDRIVKNVLYIESIISRKIGDKNVLVIGDKTIQDYICYDLGIYDNCLIEYTNFDLRYEFPYDSDSFDFIINTEVLEHIKDRDNSERVDEFNFTGVDSFNKELYRVLKPHGYMFLTTPNTCSLKHLIKLIQNRHVDRYFYHVREYTASDLVYMMNKYGFTILDLKSFNVFLDDKDSGDSVDFSKWEPLLLELLSKFTNIDNSYRNDTFYLTVKK